MTKVICKAITLSYRTTTHGRCAMLLMYIECCYIYVSALVRRRAVFK